MECFFVLGDTCWKMSRGVLRENSGQIMKRKITEEFLKQFKSDSHQEPQDKFSKQFVENFQNAIFRRKTEFLKAIHGRFSEAVVR